MMQRNIVKYEKKINICTRINYEQIKRIFISQSFLCWSFLWDEKRDIELKAFTAKELLAVEIRERFLKYEQITESINKIEDHYCIGSIQVEMCK